MRLIFTKIQQLNTTYKWQHEVMTAKLVARKKEKKKKRPEEWIINRLWESKNLFHLRW